ncbi:class I SAM-dependent methyltransferase [Porticoccaceae bacterium]|nr:class I SAM-dependent methyltransferase [Porticoccaceae bacterium]
MKSNYTQDVQFDSAFGALQTPAHLFTAALLNGTAAAPVNCHFRYLDVACGNGLTLSLLAEAYPFADFVGIDINEKHIEEARSRAEAACMTNISFVQGDLATVTAEEFEPFDYCAIVGVYSWLDAYRRKRAREFIKNVVKPGGLVYLDYSSQPGMAQTAPLYHMIKQIGAVCDGDSAQQLASASSLLNRMREGGARFFEQNNGASARLAGILQNPPADEAHEVFNLQEMALWSSEVIESLEEEGFRYVGSSILHQNMSGVTSPSVLPKESSQLPLALRQLLQDVAWNVAHRNDLYVNGNTPESADLQLTLLDSFPYVAPGALNEANLKGLSKAFPRVDFTSRPVVSVTHAAKRAQTFGDLYELASQEGISATEITEVVTILLAARVLSVAITPIKNQPTGEKLSMPSKLNRMILMEDISQEHARPFASPVVGTRVLMPIRDRVYVWALVLGDVGKAWDAMGELREAFRGDRGEPLNRSQFVEVVSDSMVNFEKTAVPELLRLGILEYQ